MMKRTLTTLLTLAALFTSLATADEAAKKAFSFDYEGQTYSFATQAERDRFEKKVTGSLYHQIGGKAAVDAAVDLFYTKVLADDKVNFFFDDVNMKRQHSKQKAFLSAAFGSPVPYEGKDMRTAHAQLDLTEAHFAAIAGHLQATLTELKLDQALIDQIMAIAASTKDDVLNQPKAGK